MQHKLKSRPLMERLTPTVIFWCAVMKLVDEAIKLFHSIH
jgi:hypothetical protein